MALPKYYPASLDPRRERMVRNFAWAVVFAICTAVVGYTYGIASSTPTRRAVKALIEENQRLSYELRQAKFTNDQRFM